MQTIDFVTFPYQTSQGTILHLPAALPNQAPLFDGMNPAREAWNGTVFGETKSTRKGVAA
jgi:hypothetical protein